MPTHQKLLSLRGIRPQSQKCHTAVWMTTRCISIPARDNQAPRMYAWNADNLPPSSRNAQISLTKFDEKSPDTEDVDKRRRRIFVFGVGNLGRIFASSLAKLRQPPPITLVVHRRHMLDSWHKTPGIVMIRDGEADRNCLDVDIEWWTDEKPEIGPVREPGKRQQLLGLPALLGDTFHYMKD